MGWRDEIICGACVRGQHVHCAVGACSCQCFNCRVCGKWRLLNGRSLCRRCVKLPEAVREAKTLARRMRREDRGQVSPAH